VNVIVWRAVSPPEGNRRGLAVVGVLFAIALPWLWGMKMLQAAPPVKPDAPVVELVQGNVTGEIKWGGKHQREILDTFVRLSESGAGAPRPILIVWPETATGSYLWRQLDQALRVADLAARTGAPVFTGFPDYRFDSTGATIWENSAGLFPPDGRLARPYAKIHLVPFGERMPFERWIPALGHVALGQAEWRPGEKQVLFPSAAGPFGCLICFEAIYPELARGLVRSGARWLVNITNDEWFGDSPALGQHAAMSVFRAVEHHVPLARCANTGITMMVDANGRVTARVPVWSAQVLRAPLPAAGIPTPYTKLGDWPALLALAGLVIAPIVSLRTRAGSAR
jgi:apolipoprotein N-acyltransferase